MFGSTWVRHWAVITLVHVLLLVPVAATGQSALTQRIVPCDGTDCTICHIATLAQNLLNFGIYVAVFLSAVLFAWAGFKALTAAGNSEKYADAKRIFGNVLIGLVIILTGWLIIDTLMKTMTDGSFGPWNKICDIFLTYFEHFYA